MQTRWSSLQVLGDGAPVVHCVWGDAQWSRTQLLGEIARGHWGLCHASVAEMLAPPTERWAALDGRLVFAPETEMMEDVRAPHACRSNHGSPPHHSTLPDPSPLTAHPLCAAHPTRCAQFIRRGVAEMERERALQSRAADASASAVEAAEDAEAAAAAEAAENADADSDAGEALAAEENGGEEEG